MIPHQRQQRRRVFERVSVCAWSRPSPPRLRASLGMPSPAAHAGNRPTADITLVRPPTQSHIGNLAIQPLFLRLWSSLIPTPVTATACSRKESLAFLRPRRPRACHCASRAFRRTWRSPPPAYLARSIPDPRQHPVDASGSVLSRKCDFTCSRGVPEHVGDELRSQGRAADADHEQVA